MSGTVRKLDVSFSAPGRNGQPTPRALTILDERAWDQSRGIGTGSKVWCGGRALASYAEQALLRDKFSGDDAFQWSAVRSVVELGAGTGIAGMALARCLGNSGSAVKVALTDEQRVLAHLQQNVDANFDAPEEVLVRELSWGNQQHIDAIKAELGPIDVIVAADLLYAARLHSALIDTIRQLARRPPGDNRQPARLLLTYGQRDPMEEHDFMGVLDHFFDCRLVDEISSPDGDHSIVWVCDCKE
ncbi:Protein-lysine N-methyltransferase efm6 [Sorochytrium milnesiophthora]